MQPDKAVSVLRDSGVPLRVPLRQRPHPRQTLCPGSGAYRDEDQRPHPYEQTNSQESSLSPTDPAALLDSGPRRVHGPIITSQPDTR
jgi:hypothetical protein